jgi:uncharacterized membrane protein YhaH (DUF805 family)
MRFSDLWSWEGTIDRGPYALVGLIGFAIKHNLDRVVATLIFHRRWSLFNYWIPFDRAVRITSLDPADRTFLFTMLLLSLPFIWVGVVLTMRRLRAMGLPAWLVVFFFAPYVNLLFFVVLCIYPSQSPEELSKPPRERENRMLRSTLRGSGLGARRECQFSSGQFVEPIEIWEENRRLRFSISGEPAVMEELSPYGHIHTRHIDGQYFQAQDAEFLLTPLPNGHTLLTGTSRYRNRMWPVAYWRLWSDEIVHQIHLRVFRHIRRLAEESELQAMAR